MATSITNALATSSGNTGSSSGTSGSTSSYGLGQGIDVNQFVQMALANDQATITNLQNEQSTLGTQTSTLSAITSNINALQSAATALSDPLGALNALTATSSDSSVLSATASNSAATGTHTITINWLATTSSAYSDAVTASNTPLTGSLSIAVGGATPVSVPIDSTDGTTTLSGIASYINSHSNLGVTASVVQDANGARLALVSNTSGLPGDLTVTGSLNYTDANNNAATANFNSVAGRNASLSVDGIPVSSTSNTVSNVINGVTLNLNSAASGGSTVSLVVAPDTTQATSAINSFVSAYNTAIQALNAQFNVSSDGSGGGALEADGSVREAQGALLSAIAYSTGGNSTTINSLASIGINLNNDGTLTVDNSALSAALAQNPSAVQSFFQTTTTGFAANLTNALNGLIGPGNGVLTLDGQGITQSSQDLGQQISDLQASLAIKQQNLIQTYAQVNTTLQELPLLEAQMNQQLSSIP